MNFDIMKEKMKDVLKKHAVNNDEIIITAKALSSQDAIGDPEHNDYVIQKGKEKLLQAEYKGSYGVAFTDMYDHYNATVSEIFELNPDNNFNRAVIVASINALLKHFGYIDRTIHCKNDGMIRCAEKVCDHIKEFYTDPKIFLIGMQPRFAEVLSDNFQIRITDNDPDNHNKLVNNIEVKDISHEQEYMQWCDVIFATGSSFVNNTAFTYINSGKPVIFYGVSSAGPAYLFKCRRYCETQEC